MVQKRSLPRIGDDRLAMQEAGQAPLYYLSAVPAAGSARAFAPRAPEVDTGFRYAPAFPAAGPHRLYRDADAGPLRLQRTAALCRRLRWVSVAWGLAAAIAALLLFIQLTGGDAAHIALALALLLLNPRFVETCASIGNASTHSRSLHRSSDGVASRMAPWQRASDSCLHGMQLFPEGLRGSVRGRRPLPPR
jgi:hypothetical protein